MEQTCHRCGSVLLADTSYCGHCGAPQVRVPESLASSDSGAEISDTSSAGELVTKSSFAIGLHRRSAFKAASIAGTMMMLVLFVPRVNSLFPIWMMLGGWVAVSIYRHRTGVPVTPKSGALLGALTGLLGFTFTSIAMSAVLAIDTFVLHHGDQLQAMWRSQIEQAGAANPETQQLLALTSTPGGLATLLAIALLVMFVLCLLFSCAGGIFGAFFARHRIR